jgi:hypothetical protein
MLGNYKLRCHFELGEKSSSFKGFLPLVEMTVGLLIK